jgi:hypothetical protein
MDRPFQTLSTTVGFNPGRRHRPKGKGLKPAGERGEPLYEEKGLKQEAVAPYRIFLDFRIDAGPDIPGSADAEKRLSDS